ncbi:hypothetical protein CAPTEDRAFT_204307 [Capitella teleta]|uniref:Uncharacterized protein n=1 Tax=Capitella teleta TaxID=283909 RepID=R7VFC8_CAPTE|nr:hypothetical protein CAPTEDRAFT_204307 [Capitella teleta]|eukprot:ELU14380.1 hypothetical protein CAPTEDRAFT_204307 [Capitella teleta]
MYPTKQDTTRPTQNTMEDIKNSGLEIRATKIPNSRCLPKIQKNKRMKISRSLDSVLLPRTHPPHIMETNNGRTVYTLSLSESTDFNDLQRPPTEQPKVLYEYLEPIFSGDTHESRPHSMDATESKNERRKHTEELLRRAVAKLRDVEEKYNEKQIYQFQQHKHCKRRKKLQFPTTGLESIPEVGSPVDGDNEIQNGRCNTFQTGEGHVRRKPNRNSRKPKAKRFLELPPIVPMKHREF